ncbi:MAG: PIN-like domain-containing protein, partial [Gallionellaceae bacterium]
MKSLFPQYADVSELDYGKVWKQALFVFDTNVLLNLYRYQSNTRDELLEVLNKLSGSIWIPHHVGLEFQRNRLKVIAEQNSRFNEVRRTIEKAKNSLFSELDKLQLQTRHSLIDPQPLTSGFETLVANYLDKLAELQGTQQKPTATDPLKEKIEAIFAS